MYHGGNDTHSMIQTGKKYGQLTAIRFYKIVTEKERTNTNRYTKKDGTVTIYTAKTKPKRIYWVFKCECGSETIKRASSVLCGNTKSCGCLVKKNHGAKITHGHTIGLYTKKQAMDKTYVTWSGMKQRCNNPKHPGYKKYGARGINYCERWEKFENFLEDMGERPSREFSIDRIDGSKGYSKENCRWATAKEQARNMSTNVMIEVGGKMVKRVEEAVKMGIKSATLGNRLNSGWDDRDFSDGKKHLNTGTMQGNEKNYTDEKKKLMELFKRSAQVVSTYLSVLDSRERFIIENRLGMKDGKRVTLDEIGKIQNCTRERVRQIEARAIEKMLKYYFELSR